MLYRRIKKKISLVSPLRTALFQIQSGSFGYRGGMHVKLLQSCPTLCDSMVRLLCPWDSPWNTGVDCHALLQRIIPTQGSNLHLLHLPALAGRSFTSSVTWEAPSYVLKNWLNFILCIFQANSLWSELPGNLHNATCQLYLNILFNFEKKIMTFGDRIFKEIK